MNPDYINNSIIENTLNKFSYRPFAQNIEPYLSLKTTNNNKKWDKVFKPYNLNQTIDAKNLGRLPYDHGAYNEREHYNTFSNKNYIPPAYRINELYPGVGVLSSVFKNR
jgi:hypothetical protein